MTEGYKPCSARTQLIAFRADGGKDKVQRCGEDTAPKAFKDVTPEDCADCPVRKVVLQAAVARKDYVKTPIKNAIREEPAPAEPGFVKCEDRLAVIVPTCCGKTGKRFICNSTDCHHYKGEITPVVCAACPFKKG